MIYWIEHAPNPWVRAIAIVIIGGIAYFEYTAGENMGPWLGGYGACNDDPYDNTTPEFASDRLEDAKLLRLYQSLFRSLGPVPAALAFRAATNALDIKVTDEQLLSIHQKLFKAPKKTKKS